MEIHDPISSQASPTPSVFSEPSLLTTTPAEELVSAVENAEPLDGGGALFIDRHGHEARVEGRSIRLTSREFKLLVYLFEHRGQVVSREDVLQNVWGAEYHGGRRTVDVHVRRLRAKLGDSFPLDTLRGIGYKLRPVAQELG